MYGLATTTITVLRGSTETTPDGDEVDGTGEPIAAGVLASIQETTHQVWDAANQVRRTVRSYECSVQSDVDIRTGDTVLEEPAPGRRFEVLNASQTGGWAFTSDMTVDLKRVDDGSRGG